MIRADRFSNGFALIELSVVIAVLMVILVIGLQSFSFYQRLVLHHEVDMLHAQFLAASNRARVEQQVHEIQLNGPENSYQILGSRSQTIHKLSSGISFGLLPGIKGPPAQPKGIVRIPITFEKQRMVCFPTGTLQPGTLYITDTQKRWQYALSVPVGTISYLRKYRYHNNHWELLA